MSSYKVSVIVPVYNGEKFLPHMLDCLVNQTLGDELEIVVVDDGSTDASLAMAQKYAKAYPDRIRVVHTENGGAAHARNVGLGIATGEYLAFADCDDTVDVSMYEMLYIKAAETDSEIVTCGYLRVDGFDVQCRDYVRYGCFGYRLYQAPSLLRRNVPYSVTKLYRAEFVRANSLRFDEDLRIYEDLLFSYKALLLANRVERVSKCFYMYNYSRAGSLTYEFSEKRFDLFPAYDRLVSFYKGHGAFLTAEDELLRVFLLHVYVALDGRYSGMSERGKTPTDFFLRAREFLDKNFPWWRLDNSYFKQSKRNRLLYTCPFYLWLRQHRPEFLCRRDHRKRIQRRYLSTQKAGMAYTAAWMNEPIAKNSVLIDSQHGENLSGNMFYLIKELLSNADYKDFTVILPYGTTEHRNCFLRILEAHNLPSGRISLVKSGSVRHAKAQATAEYILSDTSLSSYYVKRAGQSYLNTWHGTPLKALGRDMNNGYATISNLTKNFSAADFLFFQNDFMAERMAGAYMYEGGANKTYLLGYPRNEIFFDGARREAVRRELGIADRQVIAYMPTWRGKARSDSPRPETEDLLREIDKGLVDGQVMYVNLHHYEASRINFRTFWHIVPFPENLENYETLNACDVLVTDYSSVMFDYATTRRKVILFAYDRKEYLADRGLYIELDRLPVPVVESVSELIEEISDASVRYDPEALFNQFCRYERPDCSRQMLHKLICSPKDTNSRSYHLDLLVFAGSLLYDSSRDSLTDLVGSWDCDGLRVALTYDMNLLQFEGFLKRFPPTMLWRGVLNPFCATTMRERKVLSLTSSAPELLYRHRKEIQIIMDRERERAFPSTKIGASLVYGRESIANMLLAIMESDVSMLYVDDVDYYSQVPRWILESFDRVFVADEEMRGESFLGSCKSVELMKDVASLDSLLQIKK